MNLPPRARTSPELAQLTQDCLSWLEGMGYAAAALATPDSGHGVAELVVQAAGRSFFVECRAFSPHPTRAHVYRLARWMSHGSHVLSVSSAGELAHGLRGLLGLEGA